jgi:hypothetical protein
MAFGEEYKPPKRSVMLVWEAILVFGYFAWALATVCGVAWFVMAMFR